MDLGGAIARIAVGTLAVAYVTRADAAFVTGLVIAGLAVLWDIVVTWR